MDSEQLVVLTGLSRYQVRVLLGGNLEGVKATVQASIPKRPVPIAVDSCWKPGDRQ